MDNTFGDTRLIGEIIREGGCEIGGMEPDTPPKGWFMAVFGVSSIFIYPKNIIKISSKKTWQTKIYQLEYKHGQK